MKKRLLKKGVLAGTIFTAALNFNACAYGPPGGMYMPEDTTSEHTNLSEEVESSEMTSADSGEKEENEESGESIESSFLQDSDFDPSRNFEATVYGPPEVFR